MTPKVGLAEGADQLPNLKQSEPEIEESGRQPLKSAFTTLDKPDSANVDAEKNVVQQDQTYVYDT